MPTTYGDKRRKPPMSLLLVEGATEVLFYNRIIDNYLSECRTTIKDLKGLFNINKKVIGEITKYCQRHEDEKIRVYCCLDRESRSGEVPGFNIDRILKHITNQNMNNVLDIKPVIATQQIESWFLYDIQSIYTFLKVPKSQRKPKAFQPPEKFTHKHLSCLFRRYKKSYAKGRGAQSFINSLDINRIMDNCEELKQGIALIKSQAEDLTNNLFPQQNAK